MSRDVSEVAARVLGRCEQHCDMALKAELDVLAQLMSLAVLQASKDLAGNRPNGSQASTKR